MRPPAQAERTLCRTVIVQPPFAQSVGADHPTSGFRVKIQEKLAVIFAEDLSLGGGKVSSQKWRPLKQFRVPRKGQGRRQVAPHPC
mmetsp:Transcript_22767/g.35774  ORF Transcript_22767/g.35774 Transcript_22767/m.35774 type:complete len:86 (-) Transcript_22767:11-268(-)